MAEELVIHNGDKTEKYKTLLAQLTALVHGENNQVANLANISAAIKETFGFLWVGFYMVDMDELVLGPFQGPIACTRIKHGKGVCGIAWKENKTQWVPDVEKFPGHIACSSLAMSEVVIPIRDEKENVSMVLDIDSDQLDFFDQIDIDFLEEIARIISIEKRKQHWR